jgi:hypothetical protein
MHKTITHTTLCLLEELNDLLYKAQLDSNTSEDLELIKYNCKLLLEITN